MIPFVSIGVEQQNKLMKIVGGIRNISFDENKLEQFFAICPLISKMDDQFQGMYNMKSDKTQTVHHELFGSLMEFLTKSVKLNKTELTEFLEPGGINQDSVLNLITHAVLEDSSELLNVHDIGCGMYNSFYNDRLYMGPLKRKQPTRSV